jgi:hypothetical protein
MRLVWENITYAQAESLCIVWDQNYGIYGQVLLPSQTLAGTSGGLTTLMATPFAGATWQFTGPPKVVPVKARRCTVEMPIGVRGFVRQDLDVGDGTQSTYDGCNTCADDDDCTLSSGGGGGIEEIIIWFDDESAQVFPPDAAVITGAITGDYLTTEHLGQTAYAPPPGTLDASGPNELGGGWVIDMPDDLTNGNFTIEGWTRSSTAAPPVGGRSTVGIALAWNGDTASIIMQSAAFRLSESSTAEHQVGGESRYETSNAQVYEQLFGTSVQGWRHLCYQRVGGEDIFHYHGVRLVQTDGDGSLPSPRPVTSDAYLFVGALNEATSGVAVGQVRVSTGALYGTGTFTPPSTAFYTAP